MKDYYVVMTGSKNNAGDFLIKYRGKRLLSHLRPDRDILDFNAWEALDNEKLSVVNDARALILLGGPSLRKNMYPGIYKLRENLDDIHVPIIAMGIGWKSKSGSWQDTHRYSLSTETRQLLKRIENSGFSSSVRDYHSLNVLHANGFSNVIMTGCPAYYDLEYIGLPINKEFRQNTIVYSLGVSFVDSKAMERHMKQEILRFCDYFSPSPLTVVFHHSLNNQVIKNAYSNMSRHVKKHKEFAEWLTEQGIAYIDISGSAENLMKFYSKTDVHIGYRVHAHIFMNSIARTSLLMAEDGRGFGVARLLGNGVFTAFSSHRKLGNRKMLRTLGIDPFRPNEYSVQDCIAHLKYEKQFNRPYAQQSRLLIDQNYKHMEQFLLQLP